MLDHYTRRASQDLPLTQGEVAQSAGEGVVKTALLYLVFQELREGLFMISSIIAAKILAFSD